MNRLFCCIHLQSAIFYILLAKKLTNTNMVSFVVLRQPGTTLVTALNNTGTLTRDLLIF